MSGSIYLYVSNKGKVHKIPKPKDSVHRYRAIYKAVPSLANENVLLVVLGYETLNRKPYELDIISFRRVILDDNGVYKPNYDNWDSSLTNFLNFDFVSADNLADSDIIPMPVAPDNIPTEIEKKALYSYVKENYPLLWVNCSYIVEKNIKSIEQNYNELKNLVKEAYKKKFKCS